MPASVSIVMPVQNVQSTVDVAIQSIISQTLPDWELVVLDDGSTDDTVSHLRAWAATDRRVRPLVDGRSLGISARLNEGVHASTGALIARMDGDDICYPHRLETQVDFLRSNPGVDLVGAGSMVFTSDGAPRGPRCRPGLHEELTAHALHGIPIAHPTWMGLREWFERHPYDGSAVGCEDAELLLRAHTSSRYANLPDVLIGYREDRIKLRRSLDARLHETAYLLRYGIRERRLVSCLVASAFHLAKGARDVAAVATGRQNLVLARRNRVPSPAEVTRWQAIWAGLTS